MSNLDKKEQFVELRAKGKSFAVISEEIGVSKTSLIEWSRDLAEQISNLRAIETEAMVKQYKIGKEHRIKVYTERLEKIREELNKRGLKGIPTAKLVELEMKVVESLSNEEYRPTFQKTLSVLEQKDVLETLDSWSP